MSDSTLAAQLENYTLKHPAEVLLVHMQLEGEPDQVIIFRGFSSSLMRPTAFDPEVPMLPDTAVVSHIDRLQGPYQPQSPQYIERDITLEAFLDRLQD
ncbi:MAG: hypothetical protein AAF810_06745 [Cyanobacteria bacterium P01_D01_bin.36]